MASLGDLHLAELHERAAELGVPGYRMLRRDELVDEISRREGGRAPDEPEQEGEFEPEAAAEPEPAAEPEAEPEPGAEAEAEAEVEPEPDEVAEDAARPGTDTGLSPGAGS
jgi:hypothetical protein